MKGNIKFFGTVAALLLAFSIILMGCMYAIAAERGEMKSYDMGIKIENSIGIIAEGDTPIAQAELQKKFYAMYRISDDEKCITVISDDYLSEFWQSSYEREVIHSLTAEEVLFIIQDSIRIYQQYETIVLPAFASDASDARTAERFPLLEKQVIDTKRMQSQRDYNEDTANICNIILYRLAALSSPDAFITGAEAIIFSGGIPGIYNSRYPETVFYIPGYAEETDRDYILNTLGLYNAFTDLDRELFIVSPWEGDYSIKFSSKGSDTSQVFPTAEMEEQQSAFSSSITNE